MVQVQQGEPEKKRIFRFFLPCKVARTDNICNIKRQLIFYGRKIISFLEALDDESRDKLEWTLELIRTLDIIPLKYFKHLEGTKSLYEIRVESGSIAYRLFCFFDKGNIIVVVSGFIKKQQKTPLREIQQALKLKKQYHEEKK